LVKTLSPKKQRHLLRLRLENSPIYEEDLESIFITDVVYPDSTASKDHTPMLMRYQRDVRALAALYFECLTGINPDAYAEALASG